VNFQERGGGRGKIPERRSLANKRGMRGQKGGEKKKKKKKREKEIIAVRHSIERGKGGARGEGSKEGNEWRQAEKGKKKKGGGGRGGKRKIEVGR